MNNRLRVFFKAFTYAWNGLLLGMKTERNLKFHAFAAIVVTAAGYFTGLSSVEWLVIFILFGGMAALELMNSAVERTVDLVTDEFHPLAKQAKDFAAAAVLIFAMMSAVIGLFIFLPKWFAI